MIIRKEKIDLLNLLDVNVILNSMIQEIKAGTFEEVNLLTDLIQIRQIILWDFNKYNEVQQKEDKDVRKK